MPRGWVSGTREREERGPLEVDCSLRRPGGEVMILMSHGYCIMISGSLMVLIN
jgi:hypothetical protein